MISIDTIVQQLVTLNLTGFAPADLFGHSAGEIRTVLK